MTENGGYGSGAGQPWVLAERYRVDGLVGRGGMSQVWHGYDERLDRRVAIKLMLPTGPVPAVPDSPEALEIAEDLRRDRERFVREIRTTARLEHPGIPAVYDTGIDPGTGRVFLVMQLLSGSTLREAVRHLDYVNAPPPPGWTAAIGAQIAATLADVHRVKVVHRDIKPENVMLTDGGLVKILDFGISILKGAGALPRLTQLDRTVGTPPYMSPEQSMANPVGPATDIYSLGCLLHELLTGFHPYTESSEASYRYLHNFAPVPSVLTLRPDVPAEIDKLVTAMLAKQPAIRPDAEAVYETLLPFARTTLSGGPFASPDRDPRRPFLRPLTSAGRRSANLAAATDPISETEAVQLQERAAELANADQPQQAIDLLEAGIERARHDPVLALSLRHALASVLFYADEHTKAARLFDAVGQEYGRVLGSADPMVVACSYYAGYSFAENGDPDKALAHLRFYVSHVPEDDPAQADQRLEAQFLIAKMLEILGHAEDALADYLQLRTVFDQLYGSESVHVRNLNKQIARLQGPSGA